MVKKISISILSVAIVILGIIAFNQFRYWERSIAIFKMNNEQSFGRGFGGGRNEFGRNFGRGRFEGSRGTTERPDFRNIPDSVRQRRFSDARIATRSDSLRPGRMGSFPSNRPTFRNEGFDRSRQRGGNFRRGNNVQLRNVFWFLSVFAAFTTITVYIDKYVRYLTKGRKNISITHKRLQ